MKTIDDVTDAKLRGGFYTPPPLVALCLRRVAELVGSATGLRVLEPSVGDGAFIRGLVDSGLAKQVEHVLALEVEPEEAAKARSAATESSIDATVLVRSAIDWAATAADDFDVAVGNPPFVRFQFIDESDLLATELLAARLEVPLRGVGNLWIPVLLGALSRIREGGALAFVVPSELFTGLSAGAVRKWLLAHVEGLRIDLFEPGSFPGVLQEVLVLSGRKAKPCLDSKPVEFVEHDAPGVELHWAHSVNPSPRPWTRLLLTPRQFAAQEALASISSFQPLAGVARLEVSIVTGANDFFSVTDDTAKQFELCPWVVPLLPRARYARGLEFRLEDHGLLRESGAPCWLLSFDAARPDPMKSAGARAYLNQGEARGLHLRYKTGIRAPWYRVPSVWAGTLLLSKRSHQFSKLIVNTSRAVTTDTIYRGVMRTEYVGQERALAASFHNSASLLTTELEGRSFGGGVLELVPSEVARILVPLRAFDDGDFSVLDGLARGCSQAGNDQPVIDATDEILLRKVHDLDRNLLDDLRSAHQSLLQRRLRRN